ncbi:hypothetical protein [Rhodosalinus halophilus]|uniref:hypothetical protein n=1 Tax=Rhodosalinus halophilus TaxID=2259333 RepID=UPI001F48D553|nr:hypothetical protein [Rhodosalinus halophilus]
MHELPVEHCWPPPAPVPGVASRPGLQSALPRDVGHVAAQIEAGIPECVDVDPSCLERIVACNRLAIRPFAKNGDQDDMQVETALQWPLSDTPIPARTVFPR